MSFDLGVWSSSRPISIEEARDIYSNLCHRDTSVLSPAANSKEAIEEFVTKLTRTYPQIDDVREEEIDDCPWNIAFALSDAHVIMSMAWSRVDEVAPYVAFLAYTNNLICYDPQQDVVMLPRSLETIP